MTRIDPTKKDLLDYIEMDKEYIEDEYAYAVFTDNTDKKMSRAEQIIDVSLEKWFLDDLYRFAESSEEDNAYDILGDYTVRIQNFYKESSSKAGKKIFQRALDDTSQLTELLMYMFESEDEEIVSSANGNESEDEENEENIVDSGKSW